ncbi:MAG: tail fiber domain-containing protein, partial [Flavobacteriales bacterium]|nr:tail fiber domain-containing protein [Flavobacteriales bacterium]
MLNHSVISWSNELDSPGFYMGMPNWPADHSFYCAMATNLQGTGVSNFVYRIVNNPIIGTTSPNQGDMDYFHSINIYKNLGIGLNAGVSNILNPTNRVEINTTATSGGMAPPVLAPNGNSGSNVPNFGGGTGFSGLRFTDLRANSAPYSANPGSGVLAVDVNGDVIYVPDAINNATNANNGCSIDPLNPDIVQWGQDINAAGNPAQLLNNREIPLMNKNVYFLGQNPTTQGINAIGIGYPNTVAQLPARMSVWENPGQNVSFNTVGILGLNSSTPALISGLSFVGVAGYANGIDSMENKNEHIGGYFRADGGMINYGVKGIASMGHPSFGNKNHGGDFLANANQSNSTNHGVHSMALNGQISYAGWFAAGGAQTENIGLNTMASGNTMSSVNIGIRTSAGGLPGSYTYAIYAQAPVDSGFSYAGWFEGDVHVNGVVTTSDSTIKENINPLQSVSQQLSQLNPVSFNYKQNAVPQLTLDTKQHFGLLAQEVELIWPALVQNSQIAPVFDSTGAIIHPAATVKSLNYIELITLLIAGYKEQEEKIKQQDSILQNIQQEIQMLTGVITKCCSQSQLMLTPDNNQQYPSIQHQYTMDIILRNEDMIVLNQNAPNPFKEQTTITWYLPERVQRAQLIFTNNWGQVIKMADIRETGHGRIIVYADDLSSGIYN